MVELQSNVDGKIFVRGSVNVTIHSFGTWFHILYQLPKKRRTMAFARIFDVTITERVMCSFESLIALVMCTRGFAIKELTSRRTEIENPVVGVPGTGLQVRTYRGTSKHQKRRTQ